MAEIFRNRLRKYTVSFTEWDAVSFTFWIIIRFVPNVGHHGTVHPVKRALHLFLLENGLLGKA